MASAADDRFRLLVERRERLEEEKKALGDDIRDLMSEVSAVGYDKKIFNEIIKLRKMKPDDRRERDAILEAYRSAIGLD